MNWLRSFFYQGRHHFGDSDLSPAGQVWFHEGTWWTFPRRSHHRVPRHFESRANPLDHEEVLDYEVPVEPRMRRVYREVEY